MAKKVIPLFALHDLDAYHDIVIQCHDNPDADTIACAFAIGRYFTLCHRRVRLVYGGFNPIRKPNLLAMFDMFSIPLEFVGRDTGHIQKLCPGAENPLLITVDCQHRAGNVTKIQSDAVCVIDHHIQETSGFTFSLIEPYLGSCATVIWRLLTQESFDFTANRDISTALYYGLYTDTNSFSEIFHPLDRDMLEALVFDHRIVKHLKSVNLTRQDLSIASRALSEADYDQERKCLLFEAEPCDPNILGFISDLTLQVENVDTCVGYCQINGGVKLSLRSATYDVMANELAAFITEGSGSGGGNKEKAGGFMRVGDGVIPQPFIRDRISAYFDGYDKVVAKENTLDLSQMKQYRKKQLVVGVVRLIDLYPEGTDVYVRTLEGDAAFTVTPDSFLMIGIQGETYPIQRAKFERTYETMQGIYELDPSLLTEGYYPPTVKDKLYQRSIDLMPHATRCRSKQRTAIYARPVDKPTKVFTEWYTEGYMLGKPGDYIAVRCDDSKDVYIIDAAIFSLTYEELLS